VQERESKEERSWARPTKGERRGRKTKKRWGALGWSADWEPKEAYAHV